MSNVFCRPAGALSAALPLFLLLLSACGGGGSSGAGSDDGTDGGEPAQPSSFIAADPGPGSDYALGMDSFPDRSTVVSGWFPQTHVWSAGRPEETSRTSVGSHDGYVARYDPRGTLMWVEVIQGSEFITADEVVALSDGSSIVMGDTAGSAVFAPGTAQQFTIAAGPATFVARYLADGTLDWVKVIAGFQVDVRDKCRFADDSVAFCGRISASAVFGAGDLNETDLDDMSASAVTDFVARYAKSGSLVYAIAPSDSAGSTFASGVTALQDGSAVVTGFFQAPATFAPGTPDEQTFTNTGFDDAYVVRISPTGGSVWARHIAGDGRELPSRATTLPNGTIALVGSFTEPTVTLNEGEADALTITGGANANTYICCYESNGSLRWAKHIRHNFGAYLNLGGIVSFSDGTLVVVGAGAGLVTVDPGGPSEEPLPAFDATDLLLVRYDEAGDVVWARRDGGLHVVTRLEGVAAYADGAIGLITAYQVSFTVDQGGPGQTTFPGEDGDDTLLIRYNPDGSHDGQ